MYIEILLTALSLLGIAAFDALACFADKSKKSSRKK